jgi:saccharopine dehydrogenase-like NADP-dependent oxidoreductase
MAFRDLPQSMSKKIIGVLGAGTIGEKIVEDLLDTFSGRVVVMSRHRPQNLPRSKRLAFRKVDVSNPTNLKKALTGLDVVIHAVHHEYNETVMAACLKTRTHYVDLGGLYHYTLKQLKWSGKFRKAGLSAVLGMGAAPGITNMLAVYGACGLTRVEAIEMRIGMVDSSTYRQTSPLSNAYSLQTLLEECSWPPAVYEKGKMKFVEPFGGREPYKFPAPVGTQKPQYTIHSELATLPKTLKAHNVFFKIAFDDDFVEKVQTLRNVGLLEKENLPTTIAILKRLPPAIPATVEQYEIIQVLVKGRKSTLPRTVRMEAHVAAMGETIDKDTAVPASVVAQQIARGEIVKRGVFPPESIVDPDALFTELCNRGICIYKNGKEVY